MVECSSFVHEKNALHIIAERVLGVANVQKTKLVHITGHQHQALYWGWKDSLRNETEKVNVNQTEESRSVSALPPDADQITGTIIISFQDGSWGQWIEASKIEWMHASYWGELVPIEERKCVLQESQGTEALWSSPLGNGTNI